MAGMTAGSQVTVNRDDLVVRVKKGFLLEGEDFSFYTNSKDEVIIDGVEVDDTEIIIPQEIWKRAVAAIDDFTFHGSSLTSINMPSVETIGERAFEGCDSLTSVDMPSIKTIGERAFENCKSLPSIKIPASCSTIGFCAFRGCSSLKDILVDEYNTKYTSIDGVLYDKEIKTLVCCPSDKRHIDIPPTVITIADYAFHGCSSMSSIKIPVSCTSVGACAFEGCSSLEEILVDEGNTSYTSIDGVLYDKKLSILMRCPSKKNVSSVKVPLSTTMIYPGAFSGCPSLTSIDMPSVTDIGDKAFYNCQNLSSATMPSVKTIGDGAFQNCRNLASAYMPSVKTIDARAFESCYSLNSLDIPSATIIGYVAFRFCESLATINMPSIMTIGDGAFICCSSLTSIKISECIKTIHKQAFDHCSSLTSVYCYRKKPLECSELFDEIVLKRATLYVPAGTKRAYNKVEPWNGFLRRNIIEMD